MKRMKERSPERFASLGIVLSDSDEEKNDQEEHDDHWNDYEGSKKISNCLWCCNKIYISSFFVKKKNTKLEQIKNMT